LDTFQSLSNFVSVKIHLVSDLLALLFRSHHHLYCTHAVATIRFTVSEAANVGRGTKIVVQLNDECKKYSDSNVIQEVLEKHSNFVSYPIILNGKRMNTVEALWTRQPSKVRHCPECHGDNDCHCPLYHSVHDHHCSPYFRKYHREEWLSLLSLSESMITADYSIKESMTPVHTVTASLITNRCVSMMNTMPITQSRSLSLARACMGLLHNCIRTCQQC